MVLHSYSFDAKYTISILYNGSEKTTSIIFKDYFTKYHIFTDILWYVIIYNKIKYLI